MIIFPITGPHTDHPCRIFKEQTPRKEPVPENKDCEPEDSKSENRNESEDKDAASASQMGEGEPTPKVIITGIVADGNAANVDKKNAPNIGDQDNEKTDLKFFSGRLKRPAVSFERFLRESEKRRRVVLDGIISTMN